MPLDASATIAACERQLDAAVASAELRVPTRARFTSLGGEISLAQLVVTWAQAHGRPHLGTYAADGADPQIGDLVRRLYGLTAAVCATKASGRTPGSDVTKELMAAALAQVARLQGDRPTEGTRGPSTEVVCVDHLGRGMPASLYRRTEDGGCLLRDRTDYRSLARRFIRDTLGDTYSKPLGTEVADAVGSLLYEVFRNTDDHALRDIAGNVLERSVRILRISHLSPGADELARTAADFRPLSDFCRTLNPEAGSKQVHMLEVSVLDSGPGFAQRWTGRPLADLGDGEEMRAVTECFSAGSSKASRRFGEGLPHVVRLLGAHGGFIRLRTGRLSLFVDFRAEPALPGRPFTLSRWQPPEGGRPAAVAGTLVTMLVPLKRR